MRTFIRHPAEVPISYSRSPDAAVKIKSLKNLSHGGLSFYTSENVPIGTVLQITIPNLKYHFCAKGTVVWSRKNNAHYQIGVKFSDDKSTFRMRMIEQVCYIDAYRKKVKTTEHRELSWKEASAQWIQKYAGEFPSLED